MLPRQQLLFLWSSKIKAVYAILTLHAQISQHTVCSQTPTPPHIYNTKSVRTCLCIVRVCMHVSVPTFVLLQSCLAGQEMVQFTHLSREYPWSFLLTLIWQTH
jgi:hypothetical protein